MTLKELPMVDGGGLQWWSIDNGVFMQVDGGEDGDACGNRYRLEK